MHKWNCVNITSKCYNISSFSFSATPRLTPPRPSEDPLCLRSRSPSVLSILHDDLAMSSSDDESHLEVTIFQNSSPTSQASTSGTSRFQTDVVSSSSIGDPPTQHNLRKQRFFKKRTMPYVRPVQNLMPAPSQPVSINRGYNTIPLYKKSGLPIPELQLPERGYIMSLTNTVDIHKVVSQVLGDLYTSAKFDPLIAQTTIHDQLRCITGDTCINILGMPAEIVRNDLKTASLTLQYLRNWVSRQQNQTY